MKITENQKKALLSYAEIKDELEKLNAEIKVSKEELAEAATKENGQKRKTIEIVAQSKDKAQDTKITKASNNLVKAENHLVKLCLPLVEKMARDFNNYKEYEDLISSGHEGLIFAIRNFKEEKIDTFFHYLEIKTKGAMKDYLRNNDEMSRNRRDNYKRHKKASDSLVKMLGREPSETETAAFLTMDLNEYQKFKNQNLSPINVSQLTTVEGETELLLNNISSEKDIFLVQKEQLIQDHQIQDMINQHLNDQPDEKTKLVFSLQHNAQLSIKEIAHIFGVSDSRVSQINSENIKKLVSCLLENQKLRTDFTND